MSAEVDDGTVLKTDSPPSTDEVITINSSTRLLERRTLFNIGGTFWSRNVGSGILFPNTLTDKIGFGTILPEGRVHILSSVVSAITIDPDADELLLENDGNDGYTVAPSISIPAPPTPVNATATANLVTGVKTVTLVGAGTGYTEGETVTLLGGTSGANNATATITVTAGVIQTITIVNKGSGYTSAETLTITGVTSGQADATGTANTTEIVDTITIILSGQGYTSTPTITINDSGSGTGATATSVLVNTKVTVINVTAGGEDYTAGTISVSIAAPPSAVTATGTVNIAGGKAVSVTLTNIGSGYFNPPPLPNISGGDGTGAGIDIVTLSLGTISSITITLGGTGMTLLCEENQKTVIDHSHPGSSRHGRQIFDHNFGRYSLVVNGVQAFIADTNANVAISSVNTDFDDRFTVRSDVSNIESKISIGDNVDRLKLGYNGSIPFVTNGIFAQVIVPTNSDDLVIASGGASASNVLFYTSAGSGLVERMRIHASGTVTINNTTDLTDLTIFQNATNTKKGLTFTGQGLSGPSSTTDGVLMVMGFNGGSNRQLWIGQKSDIGNSAKNFFRILVGGAVPNISGVNGDDTIQAAISIGDSDLVRNVGIGFPGTILQTDIKSKLHLRTGTASNIGFILQETVSQTADLFQVRNSADAIISVIDKDNKWGLGITPTERLHVAGNGLFTGTVTSKTIVNKPAAPVFEGVTALADTKLDGANGVFIHDHYLIVVSNVSNNLSVIDIKEPDAPVRLGSTPIDSRLDGATNVFVVGNIAYVTAKTENRLVAVDISNKSSPVILGSLQDNTNFLGIDGVFVKGQYAFVTAATSNIFAAIDISNPAAMVSKGTFTEGTFQNYVGIHVKENVAFITSRNANALLTINIEDVTSMSLIGSFQDNTNLLKAESITISGKYALIVSSGANSLTLVDISNTTTMTLVGTVSDSDTALSATIAAGGTGYTVGDDITLVGGTGVASVFNVDTVSAGVVTSVSVVTAGAYSVKPTNPVSTTGGTGTGATLTVTFSVGALTGVKYLTVAGDFVYATSPTNDTIATIDITTPTSPTILGSLVDSTNIDGAAGIGVTGTFAYVAGAISKSIGVYNIHGLSASSAMIGTAQIGTLYVTESAIISNSLHTSSLNVSHNAMIGGQLSVVGMLYFDDFANFTHTDPTLNLNIKTNAFGGLSIQNTDGSVFIGDGTGIADAFLPFIRMRAKNSLVGSNILGQIPDADDTGDVPVMSFNARNLSNTAIITRPLFAFENGGVHVWTLDADGITHESVEAGITAFATGGQASATLLSKSLNEISTVATASDSVKLHSITSTLGEIMTVINNGVNALDVFPNTGHFINGLAVNTAFTIAAGARFIFKAYSSTKWVTF